MPGDDDAATAAAAAAAGGGGDAAAAAEVEVNADGSTAAESAAPLSERLVLGEEGGQMTLDTAGLEGVEQTKFEYLHGRFGGPRPRVARELVSE